METLFRYLNVSHFFKILQDGESHGIRTQHKVFCSLLSWVCLRVFHKKFPCLFSSITYKFKEVFTAQHREMVCSPTFKHHLHFLNSSQHLCASLDTSGPGSESLCRKSVYFSKQSTLVEVHFSKGKNKNTTRSALGVLVLCKEMNIHFQ